MSTDIGGTVQRTGASAVAPGTGPSAVVVVILVTVGYGLGALAAWLLFGAAHVAVFYPPAGVTLAGLLLLPRRRWGLVLVPAAIVEVLVDWSQGQSGWVIVGFVAANTLEPLLGATMVRRFSRSSPLQLDRRAGAAGFLLGGAVIGPLLGATIGALTIHLGLGRSFWTSFGPFWAGDALAVTTLGAALTSLGLEPRWSRREAWLGVGLLTGTAALTGLGFWSDTLPLAYLPLPLLVVAAFTGRVAVVTACGFVFAFVANLISGLGHGPWAPYLTSPDPTATVLQLFLAVATLTGWALTIEIAERERARSDVRREAVLRKRLQTLQDVTARLSRAVGTEEVADILLLRGAVMLAEHGVIATFDESEQAWHTTATAQFPREVARRFARIPAADADLVPITAVARHGDPVTLLGRDEILSRFPLVGDSLERTGTRSMLIAPFPGSTSPIGALALGFAHESPPEPDLVELAATLAELGGQALERAQLYEREHAAAHELQQALLPSPVLRLPGVDVGAIYQPAHISHEVGGDWYDVFALPGGRVGFCVGDVVGHDLRAAITMNQIQGVLRFVARAQPDPAAVITALDTACAQIARSECTTLGYADYDPLERRLRYACAGHPPPLLAVDGEIRYLDGGRSRPIDVPGEPRTHAELVLPGDAVLIWYSDGLVERRGRHLDEGLDLLARQAARITRGGGVDDVQRIAGDLLDAMAADYPEDDTVVMCLRLTHVGSPAPQAWATSSSRTG